MQQYDVRLKAILQRAMPRFFRLLGFPAEVAEYLTVEFPARQKVQADAVVRFGDGRILHLEWQARNDPGMPVRCLDYYRAILGLWPEAPEIIQVVVYLGPSPAKMTAGIKRDRLDFSYDIVVMADLDAGEFLASESDDERILAVLCESADPRATIRTILASWKHLPAKEISEKMLDLRVLSQLRKQDTMVQEECSAMPIEIDITENAFYKWAEAQGEANVLKRFLLKRFGPLPAAIEARLSKVDDTATVDRWLDRLDDATSLDDVFAD